MYGNVFGQYSTKNKATALSRMEAASAIFFSTPGPKMVWQFGELGFDLSINRCEDGSINNDCRLSKKPPVWDYQQEPNRQRLYNVYKRMIEIKTGEDVFNTTDFVMDVDGAVKKIALNLSGSDVRTVANFDVEAQPIQPGFSTTGWWYNAILNDSINVTDVNMQLTFQPGEYAVYSQKKLNGFDTETAINDNMDIEKYQAKVYPNPFNSNIHIETEIGGNKWLELYSLTGACVKKASFNGSTFTINGSNLPAGHYIIKLFNGKDVVYKKIVKQ